MVLPLCDQIHCLFNCTVRFDVYCCGRRTLDRYQAVHQQVGLLLIYRVFGVFLVKIKHLLVCCSDGGVRAIGRITSILAIGTDVLAIRDALHDSLLDSRRPAAVLNILPLSISITSPGKITGSLAS